MSTRLARTLSTACVALAAAAGGCATSRQPPPAPVDGMPRELEMVSQPAYTLEPPDLIQIDLLSAVPRPPYRVRPLDVLGFSVPDALPEAPISSAVTVDPDGTAYLGAQYGTVAVAGKTLPEVRAAAEEALGRVLRRPTVTVSLVQSRAAQQVRGPHLVRGDGTVGLGAYGAVRVVGLTVPQAKRALEAHLAQFFLDPDVSVDVVGYNSRVYYVAFDYGGAGQQLTRLPLTGNETVLDALSQAGGLPAVADGSAVWVARRAPAGCPAQVLPVDWCGVVERGEAATNYQLLPGDRVFVQAHPLVRADVRLGRLLAPVERVLGVTLLGASTVNTLRTDPNQLNGNAFR